MLQPVTPPPTMTTRARPGEDIDAMVPSNRRIVEEQPLSARIGSDRGQSAGSEEPGGLGRGPLRHELPGAEHEDPVGDPQNAGVM